MDIIQAARLLGKAIQEDERYKAYHNAKIANDTDGDLQKLIGEFNLLRMQIDDEMTKEDSDKEKLKSLNEQLRKTYADAMVNENMQAYTKAKNELDEVVNRMNAIIELCLDGADPDTCEPADGCTGSCSTCGGCH